MARRQPVTTTAIITISFVGLYLITCIWSFATFTKYYPHHHTSLILTGTRQRRLQDKTTTQDPTSLMTGKRQRRQHHPSLRKSSLQDITTTTTQDEVRIASSSSSRKELYNFTAAICVCVKDAEAYFEEFIEYHLAMGFANVYLYDDSPNFELERWYNHTRSHPTFSKVEVLHFSDARTPQTTKKNSNKNEKEDKSSNDDDDDDDDGDDDKEQDQEELPIDPQTDYYEDCVQRFGFDGPKHDYFAFIDVDEFFVLMDDSKYDNILGVLEDYLVPFGGALTVNWMLVGSSDKSVYAPLPVTKRFQYRDNKPHFVIKSIVKTSDYLGHRNPHAVFVRDANNNNISDQTSNIHTTAYPGALHKYASTPRGATDKTCPSKVILLYHYRYTSEKEYIFKRCTRGGTDGGHYWCSSQGNKIRQDYGPKHIQSIPGSVFDDKPWKFLTSHVPKYKMYEKFEDFH